MHYEEIQGQGGHVICSKSPSGKEAAGMCSQLSRTDNMYWVSGKGGHVASLAVVPCVLPSVNSCFLFRALEPHKKVGATLSIL